MLFHDFGTVKNRCISSIQATNAPVQKNFFSVFISTDSLDLGKQLFATYDDTYLKMSITGTILLGMCSVFFNARYFI